MEDEISFLGWSIFRRYISFKEGNCCNTLIPPGWFVGFTGVNTSYLLEVRPVMPFVFQGVQGKYTRHGYWYWKQPVFFVALTKAEKKWLFWAGHSQILRAPFSETCSGNLLVFFLFLLVVVVALLALDVLVVLSCIWVFCHPFHNVIWNLLANCGDVDVSLSKPFGNLRWQWKFPHLKRTVYLQRLWMDFPLPWYQFARGWIWHWDMCVFFWERERERKRTLSDPLATIFKYRAGRSHKKNLECYQLQPSLSEHLGLRDPWAYQVENSQNTSMTENLRTFFSGYLPSCSRTIALFPYCPWGFLNIYIWFFII